MSYVNLAIVPVPTENREAYLALEEIMAKLFVKHGALSYHVFWEDQIPDGKKTDLKKAVALQDGEAVIFGIAIWPDKATADAAMPKFMEDPDMAQMANPPFDGSRLIHGAFEEVVSAKK